MTEEEAEIAIERIRLAWSITYCLVRYDPTPSEPLFMKDGKAPDEGGLLGSGFVVKHEKGLFLLSAKHVLGHGTWGLERGGLTDVKHAVEVRDCKGTPLMPLKQIRLSGSADLAVVLLRDGEGTPDASTVRMYQGPLDGIPNADEPYFYCARNQAKAYVLFEKMVLDRENSFEPFMNYDGIETEPPAQGGPDFRGCYRFRVARKVPKGHDFYKGASGAPIIASDGAVISLVQGGDAVGTIYGVPLASALKELVDKL